MSKITVGAAARLPLAGAVSGGTASTAAWLGAGGGAPTSVMASGGTTGPGGKVAGVSGAGGVTWAGATAFCTAGWVRAEFMLHRVSAPRPATTTMPANKPRPSPPGRRWVTAGRTFRVERSSRAAASLSRGSSMASPVFGLGRFLSWRTFIRLFPGLPKARLLLFATRPGNREAGSAAMLPYPGPTAG